jgi:hypothetical protein
VLSDRPLNSQVLSDSWFSEPQPSQINSLLGGNVGCRHVHREHAAPQAPVWLHEKDWLCIIVYLPRDSEAERAEVPRQLGIFLHTP